ncbi:Wzz/FepE/Etk N-terminal domain-containing protein [Capnocytophaga sp.]|uniref:Wzz/FepE/Etk N-terminal domain-containing protein n=1 Tax=Capnocytophaga sp. TaxID=44737 RepID=UPI0026DBFD40|nr:Wzz/FepE/Etk N-terminal domain-containing protein [Capnocytophaga sp.]MDO5106191.1 Wzz/FepE/Etk N-terminal domain-containing protein [Capnocytophaga sp.]
MSNHQPHIANDEIDLTELFRKIWKSRKVILLFTLVFFLFGVLIALSVPKQYTATTIMIPQTSNDKLSAGGLGGLVAMAGIDIGATSSESIPITTYPKIINSIPFKRKLARTPLKIEKVQNEITYEEYSNNHIKPRLIDKISQYTVGLPSLLFSERDDTNYNFANQTDSILSLSKQEQSVLGRIEQELSLEVNEKESIITLSYTMNEPLAAAQMLQRAQNLLQETVTEFKVQKAREELNFIKQRYDEVEKDFKAKQFALAQFQDRNRDLFGSLPQTRLQQLQTDFNLAFNIYSELSKQLETKQIKIKEVQPIFTIIEPVSVPNQYSKPQRAIVITIWTFLGIVLGIGFIFIKDFTKGTKKQNLENE